MLFGAGGCFGRISNWNLGELAEVALSLSTSVGSRGARGGRFFEKEIPNEVSAFSMYLFCGCLLWNVRRTRGRARSGCRAITGADQRRT